VANEEISPHQVGCSVTPKDQSGMGILNLKHQNDYLLIKWLFRLLNSKGT
jgi:hypothetical protein